MLQVTFLISDTADENIEPYVRDVFFSMLSQLPGAQGAAVFHMLTSTTEALKLRYMLQIQFTDEDAMNAAFASATGKKISRELMDRSGKGVEMLTAELLT
jgi:hypothetical protein